MTLGEYLPNSNTKLLLHLNGNSTDSSGKGNVGTDTSVTYGMAYGKFGQGANFNGSSSKIQFSKNSNTYLYNNWTMSAWYYITEDNTNNLIYQMGNCGFGPGRAFYYSSDWGSGDYLLATQIFNKWTHIVYTKSSVSGIGQKLYVNGNLVASSPNRITNNSDSYSNVNVGRFDSPGNSWFKGSIDEFILEGDVWSPEKIKKYYTMTKGRFGII